MLCYLNLVIYIAYALEVWVSLCFLFNPVCYSLYNIDKLFSSCFWSVTPLNCSKTPHEDYVASPNYQGFVSRDPVQTFACEGGCGRDMELCCQPSEYTTNTAVFVNAAGQIREDEVRT